MRDASDYNLGPQMDWLLVARALSQFCVDTIEALQEDTTLKNNEDFFTDLDPAKSKSYRMELYQKICSIISTVDKARSIILHQKLFNDLLKNERYKEVLTVCKFLRNKIEHFDVQLSQPKHASKVRKSFILGFVTYETNEFKSSKDEVLLVATTFTIIALTPVYDQIQLEAQEFDRDIVSTSPVGHIWYHAQGKIIKLNECLDFCLQVNHALDNYVNRINVLVADHKPGMALAEAGVAPIIRARKDYDEPVPLVAHEGIFEPAIDIENVELQIIHVSEESDE